MLSRLPRIRAIGAQHGFTLIEVLVAMVTGMIVSLALFAILDSSTRQAAHVSETAQATQVGRTAMTRIVDALHSACLSHGFAPVQSGSTANKLIFINGYFPETAEEKTEPDYTFVHKDVIEFVPGTAKLTDTRFQAGSEPGTGEYTWKEPGTTTTFAEGISRTPVEQPVFTYYRYNTTSSTATNEAASTLKLMSPAEVEAAGGAAEVAAVNVAFRTTFYKKEVKFTEAAERGLPVDQQSLTTLALGAPNSETPIIAGPCE